MLVQQNNMTYDSKDDRCQLFVSGTNATEGLTPHLNIAFITVVDDSTQHLKRYFGVFNWDTEEESIRSIMKTGGKWPDAFKSLVLPEGASA